LLEQIKKKNKCDAENQRIKTKDFFPKKIANKRNPTAPTHGHAHPEAEKD